jgi:TatD DNase family protein
LKQYSLVDSHAHLEEMEDLGAAIERARECGVVAILAVGSDYASNQKVLEIAAKYRGFVYAGLGLHPGTLDRDQQSLEKQIQFIEDNLDSAVAVGEIGLDYQKRALASNGKDYQHRAFRDVLAIAARCGKPAVIHSRYAWKDCFNLTRESKVPQAVFHWYTGPTNVLKDILDEGYHVSATLAAEYHAEHRRAVKDAPLERLLLETDCPVVYQGHRSEPADVVRSLSAAAELKSLREELVAEKTTENALRLYNILDIS